MSRRLSLLVVAVLALAGGAGAATSSPGQGTIVFSTFLPEYPLPDNFGVDRTFVVRSGRASQELAAGAILSPDGSQVATVRGSELWVASVDGSNAHRVAAPGATISTVAWSNDGSRVAFVAGGVWVVGADGSSPREVFARADAKVVLPEAHAWSPDNTHLVAFADNNTWLIATDGSTQRLIFQPPVKLYVGPDTVFGVDWAPRTNALALTVSTSFCGPGIYQNCDDWYVVTFDRNGDRLGQIGSALDVAWSPDGTKLAVDEGYFEADPNDVVVGVAHADGSHEHVVSPRRKLEASDDCWQYPIWVGTATVAFQEDAYCQPYGTQEVGFVVARAANGKVLLEKRDGTNESFAAGGRVAYLQRFHGISHLYTARLGTAHPRAVEVAARAGPPLWSPDGRRLAFTTVDSGYRHRDLDLIAAAGGPPHRVVRLEGNRTLAPSWYGAQLAYSSHLSQSPPSIWTVRPDGSGLHRLTRGGDVDPAWSPDGRRIVFAHVTIRRSESYASAIETMRADGTGITRLPAGRNDIDTNPSWSPDGKRIVYAQESHGILVAAADGSSVRRVARQGSLSSHAWSPDGTKIGYALPFGDLDMMNADGTRATTLAQACCGAPSWSPDGTKLAFYCRACVAGGPGVGVANADGSGLHGVTPDQLGHTSGFYPEVDAPGWSPDGRQLVFSGTSCTTDADPRNGPPAICIVDADGSGLRALTPSGVGAFGPSWTATH